MPKPSDSAEGTLTISIEVKLPTKNSAYNALEQRWDHQRISLMHLPCTMEEGTQISAKMREQNKSIAESMSATWIGPQDL